MGGLQIVSVSVQCLDTLYSATCAMGRVPGRRSGKVIKHSLTLDLYAAGPHRAQVHIIDKIQKLLQNVERGSQEMTKLRATRGHSHSASTARSSKSMSDERNAFNSGVFETRLPRKTVPNIVSRSTSAHYRCYA